MWVYSGRQLLLLVALAALLLLGLAVREWRAGFPALAERLEAFDQDEPPGPAEATPPGKIPPTSARAGPTWPVAAPAPVQDPRPLDVNRATHEELSRLPGVGPALARRIVEERARVTRFESADALRRVLGLGPKKLAAIGELITVEAKEAAAPRSVERGPPAPERSDDVP